MHSDYEDSLALAKSYYAAFNASNGQAMLDCLSDDVIHDINQGARETGKTAFRAFINRMDAAYAEQLHDIALMADPTGARVAAEFVVHGTYKAADEGMPPAHGQAYILPAGAFMEVRNAKITRVSTYYNLADWIKQVS